MTQADVTEADRTLLYNLAINLECGRSRIEREQLVANHRIAARNAALEDAAKAADTEARAMDVLHAYAREAFQAGVGRYGARSRTATRIADNIRALMTKEPK